MGGEVTAPPRNPFPFQHKPNALDRDKIVIPAGWDSWGKIRILRDGFDVEGVSRQWDEDIEKPETEQDPEPEQEDEEKDREEMREKGRERAIGQNIPIK